MARQGTLCKWLPSKEAIWQALLVSNGIGAEGLLAILFVLMVANLRILGVPVAYSSTPSVAGACISSTLIVTLSMVNEKYATTKVRKAALLFFVNAFQCTGAMLIITGNMIFLTFYDGNLHFNNNSSPSEMDMLLNSSSIIESKALNSTLPRYDTDYKQLCNSSLCPLETATSPGGSYPLLPFPYYAGLVMIGFSFLDCGYDPTNCCLKTFALACTSPDTHSTVLVKAASFTSFGGVFITLLSSVGIGEWLTAGTDSNVNAVKTVFIAGLALLVGVLSLIVTLSTGLLRFSDDFREGKVEQGEDKYRYDDSNVDEHTGLLSDCEDLREKQMSWSHSIQLAHSPFENPNLWTDELHVTGSNDTRNGRKADGTKISRTKRVATFVRKSRFRILLWTGMFFSCFAFFVFDIYSVNFVGVAIFHGDPSAEVGSQEYINFMEGEEAGATGLLIFYMSCMVAGFIKNSAAVQRLGWWEEMASVSVLFSIANLCCAVYLKQWLFYVAASLNGFLRLCLYTFPYILLSKASKDVQNGGGGKSQSYSVDFAVTTAIFAFSFLVASSVSGPALFATGDAATTVYFQATGAAMALVFLWFIRKY